MGYVRIVSIAAIIVCLYSNSAIVPVVTSPGVVNDPNAFNVEMGKEKIRDILSYLYSDVLEINDPNFASVNSAQDFDSLASAAESLLPDEKVNEVEAVAKNFFPRISEKCASYLNIFASYIEDDPTTCEKTIPLSVKLGKIAKSW